MCVRKEVRRRGKGSAAHLAVRRCRATSGAAPLPKSLIISCHICVSALHLQRGRRHSRMLTAQPEAWFLPRQKPSVSGCRRCRAWQSEPDRVAAACRTLPSKPLRAATVSCRKLPSKPLRAATVSPPHRQQAASCGDCLAATPPHRQQAASCGNRLAATPPHRQQAASCGNRLAATPPHRQQLRAATVSLPPHHIDRNAFGFLQRPVISLIGWHKFQMNRIDVLFAQIGVIFCFLFPPFLLFELVTRDCLFVLLFSVPLLKHVVKLNTTY